MVQEKLSAFEEEMEEKELKPEEIVQSLPRRKVRRASITRVAEKNDLRRLSLGFSDVRSIREILTDKTFSSAHVPPDVTNQERKTKEIHEHTLKRMDTLKRAQSTRAESRRGRIESISMMMGEGASPIRPHRRSLRGSFQKINRSDQAAGDLYELMKGTEFFKQLPRKAGIEVCRHIRYKSISKGGLLFRHGEPGLSVYFILSGSVKVYLPEKDKEGGEEEPKPRKRTVVKRRKVKKKKVEAAAEAEEVVDAEDGAEVGAAEEEAFATSQEEGTPADEGEESGDPAPEAEAEEPAEQPAADVEDAAEPASADQIAPEDETAGVSRESGTATPEGEAEKPEEAEEKATELDGQAKPESPPKTVKFAIPSSEESSDGEQKRSDSDADADTDAAAESTEGDDAQLDSEADADTDAGGDGNQEEDDGELSSDEEWEFYEVEEEEPEDFGRFITELHSPSMFGELALLRESARTATVVCEPDTELMELERHDFDRILRRMGNVVFMPERLKEILSVTPTQRTAENNQMALDLLGRHKFLQNLDKEIAHQLIGKLTLSVIQENELIFRQGEVGSQFYIILTGKVHVFSDRRVKKEEPEEAKPAEEGNKEEDKKKKAKGEKDKSPKNKKGKRGAAKDEDKPDEPEAPKQGFEQSAIISETIYSGQGDRIVPAEKWAEVLGSKKQTLQGGDSFGDRALLQKNTLRTASCIAAEKTEMMVLSQADFKKLFAKDSNEVEGFERVAELLQIDSGARSKNQLDELAQLLTKTSSFFQTLDPGLHYDICQAASYKRLQSNDVVFVQGEVGDAFYVVLRGTLSLHIKGTPGLPPPKKEAKEPQPGEEGLEEEPEDLTEVYGPCISVLSGGQSFGELALLHGMPRTGTVLCQDESELLVLWKANYDEILQTSQARELERQVAFLRNLPNLDKLSTGRLMRIAYCFQLKELSRGYTLLQEGRTSEKGHVYVYIVKEGAIKMVRRTNMKKLAGAFHASVAPSARLSILSNNLGLSPRKQGKSQTMKGGIGGTNPEEALGMPHETEICVLGPGEICGDIAAFLDVPQPVSVTAVCDTVLHAVKLEDLVRSVSDETILEEFRHTSKNRLKWILEREARITSTWTSYLKQAQELRMTKDLKRASLKKGPKGDKSKTPSKKGGGGSSIVASPGMTKTSVVFQSRSLVERAEEAIKSLVKGTQKLDGKMWDTMKGMDVSMTKHYWSPAKRKKKDEEEADRRSRGVRLPSISNASTPTKKSSEASLVQILSSKSSLYLSPGQTLSPVKIPPIGTPSRFRYKRSPFNSRVVPKQTPPKSTSKKLG